ncbi:pilus assembly protein PilX [Geobacter argillaceus]|uniref:Type 4 fimbrial biogenesis protein PilX N-terminal domain-containing protein n=1 Tax=Geobacter argillaceus TaxID=345631 RepID=A0A562WR03_9BACT|nr:pilus assembly protein PilX [Geobacter argillaceus]TWJ32783.1 hypothetical protein JN12_00760 [Geobacter argillaceus]
MKHLRNQNGIALLTALMFTMLILGIIMTLLYYVLIGTKMSAAQKVYRNSLEASYGGVEVVTKTILPLLMANYSSNRIVLANNLGAADKLGLVLGPNLREKLTKPTAAWVDPAGKSVDPKVSPDAVFTLQGANQGGNFKVYSKIVDTVPGVGLIDSSGIDYLDPGIGVAGTNSSTQTPRTPSLFTIEVQGEKAVNPNVKAGLSVLYAY